MQVQELFRLHAGAVGRYVGRLLGRQSDADDVIQETYLRIWRKAQEGFLREEAKAYLFQTALNVARDVLRRRQTETRIFAQGADFEPIPDPNAMADRCVAAREQIRQLSDCLSELEEFTRTVFLLYHVEQLTVPSIAARSGKTTRTVERHLAKALAHCTRAMGPFTKDEL